MKEEWKPDALRETAEEIRSAVMPKSITPEMVGGTLLALTNAVGEVVETLGEIPRERVKVKVYGFDGKQRVSTEGGKVEVDLYVASGFPAVNNVHSEYTINENEEVEFEVPHGYGYAMVSKVPGLGASMQIVKTAARDKNNIKLYNLPIGVRYLWNVSILHEVETADAYYEYYPYVSEETFADSSIGDEVPEEEWLWRKDYDDCYSDEQFIAGILISTAETSFVIEPNNKSENSVQWCSDLYYGQGIPSLPFYDYNYALAGDAYNEAYNDAVRRASEDFNGNLNTAKIIAYSQLDTAAKHASTMMGTSGYSQRFLPSAGQLAIMQANRKAINALMTKANDEFGAEYILLPDLKTGSTNQWTGWEYWWSSTQCDSHCSWVVYSDGNFNRSYYRRGSNDVRAVSAFHFEY